MNRHRTLAASTYVHSEPQDIQFVQRFSGICTPSPVNSMSFDLPRPGGYSLTSDCNPLDDESCSKFGPTYFSFSYKYHMPAGFCASLSSVPGLGRCRYRYIRPHWTTWWKRMNRDTAGRILCNAWTIPTPTYLRLLGVKQKVLDRFCLGC
jgi:hypothetical protein